MRYFAFIILLISFSVKASGPFTFQVSEAVPFDNTTNGFVSENAQDAIEEALALAISNDRFLILAEYGGNANTGRVLEIYPNIDSQDAPIYFSSTVKVTQIVCSTTSNSSNASIGFYNVVADPSLISPLYTLTMDGLKRKIDQGTALVPLFFIPSGGAMSIKVANNSIQKPHCQIVFSSSI